MIKILSWKINSGVYAYIYPVNEGKYISKRIPEDSPIWKDVIEIMSKWDKNAYKTNFDAMNSELESKYGKTIDWDDNYWDFSDENNSEVNIVLLSGKDGVGVAGEGEKTDGDSSIDGGSIEEFIQEIENKLDKAREEIEKKNEEVENFIEEKVSQTIANAQKTINETKEELSIVREELTEGLNSAKDALKKASDLFDFNGEITQEDIIGAISTTKEYGRWLEDYSEDLTSLKTDYDLAGKKMGSIGEAEDVTDGFFTRFATSLNVMDTTVGNVERWMVASAGTVGDMASWYNTNASSATEALRYINASAGQITDVIKYVNGEEITVDMKNIMNAAKGEWTQEIISETESAITNVERKMDALSGSIEDTIVRLSDETLTSMGERMDAMNFEMDKWMTQFDELCGTTIDMRDTWTAQSGKLSTVASLTAELNENGEVIFYVSAGTDGSVYDPPIVVKRIDDGNGGFYYLHEDTNVRFTEAYPKLSTQMASYIQQEISGITLSVVNGSGLTAAIKLAITDDTPVEGGEKSIITMIADEVVIDATVIASAICATTANIGGIFIGSGQIYSTKKDNKGNPYFKLNGIDGTFSASNAYISGKVYAENGEFTGKINATSGKIGGIEINTSSLSATNFSVTSGGVVVANDIIIKGGNLIGGNIDNGKLVFKDLNGNPQTYFGQSKGDEDPILVSGFNDKITLIGFKTTGNQTRVVGGGSEAVDYIYAYTNDVDEVVGNWNSSEERTLDNITVFQKINNIYKKLANPSVTYSLKKNLKSIFIEENGSTIKNYGIDIGSNSDFNLINYRQSFIYVKAQDFSDEELKVDNATLKIFEDGSIYCRDIKTENAHIKGYIDAEGEFKGALKNAYGVLDTIKINDSLSLLKQDGKTNIFNITKNSIGGCYTTYVDTSVVNFYSQNKTTETKTYTSNKTILSLTGVGNKTVTINSFKIKLHRFIPFNKTASQGIVKIEITINGKTLDPIETTLPKASGKETQESVITYNSTKFENVNSMSIYVSCRIPTTSRYGASYCSAQLEIDPFIVTVEKEATGFFIGSDGFRYISPNGNYGLQVNDSGVKYFSAGTWNIL